MQQHHPPRQSVIIKTKVNPIIIITVKANKGKEYSTSHKLNRQRSDAGSSRERAGQKRNNEWQKRRKRRKVLKTIYR
jgi:hypothetical protein